MTRAFFDLSAAKLKFNQGVAIIIQMQHCVSFQTIAVTIIGEPAAKRLRIDL